VATDKAIIPSKVKEIASKLNARVFYPNRDLSIEEKKELTKDFVFNGKEKEHLYDALAAALYALEKHKKLIDKTLEKFGYNEEILYLVLREGNLNPEAAYIKIQKKKEEKEIKRELKKKYENEYIKLLEEENRVLREKLKKVKKYIKAYKELKSLKELVNNLYREIESLKSENKILEREIFRLVINTFLNKKFVPKYEFAKKYDLPIFFTKDISVVKKYSGIGKYKIYIPKELEDKVPFSRNIKVLDEFEEGYLFIFFEREREMKKEDENILKKIVEEYRKRSFATRK